ncbi:hypothetical protein [Halomonas daqiaonensis]|uniref:Uncharacterized protein n=1 Tax=Halomonas daqiaonensis TaxID=650850 RepID=A0A1H7L5U7_9GAMM|nr:hypothetical protein [Halomonas daqiaonensis]SEK94381.1 hypothetical protein SAMN04488129_105181 [Halomonas daqiaonensis]
MYVLRRLGAVLVRGVADMGWGVLGLLLLAYLLLAWLGLTLTGERALVDSPTTFLIAGRRIPPEEMVSHLTTAMD